MLGLALLGTPSPKRFADEDRIPCRPIGKVESIALLESDCFSTTAPLGGVEVDERFVIGVKGAWKSAEIRYDDY